MKSGVTFIFIAIRLISAIQFLPYTGFPTRKSRFSHIIPSRGRPLSEPIILHS
ncbi:hypothetical protein BJX61DRAFT_514162 [Aspergillus egyptiacus]|nr:hypothetical protein BJX61DRAFT_514162 [Aspergillus egyptiacus]